MADDWDLNAVVRSCKSAANKTASLVEDEDEDEDETLSFLASLTLLQDQNKNNNTNQYEPTNDNNHNAFQELQQFFSKPTFPHNPTTASNNTIILNSLIPDHLGVSSGQQNQMQDRMNGVVFSPQPQPQAQQVLQQRAEAQKKKKKNSTPVLLRRPVPPGYDVSPDHHPSLLLSTTTRPIRKRRNQQKKTVRTVTKENLHSDLWSWRKYGQKPIKGSPYPRNYYRCSSMKGCSARKQVERSLRNPELFVLTYTGEHRHPRPNHRNSLAGTTRPAKALPPPPAAAAGSASSSSSSPQSASSGCRQLSPTTPLCALAEEEMNVTAASIGGEYCSDVNSEIEKGLIEEGVLIPNVVFSDDFFNDILV